MKPIEPPPRSPSDKKPGPVPLSRIRNFSIIAHIDHGKSTLADRLLLRTRTIDERQFHDQVLDDMELEQERGITIKARAVRMLYTADDGLEYQLNLIDTPGHVDFSYEVSRSLAACQGALLVVDAAQGVEAQTVANTFLALEGDLEIVPVMNKIDLVNARPEEVELELEQTFGFKVGESFRCSAKAGIGIDELLEAIVMLVPAPNGDPASTFRALIFDSHYDAYRGVTIYVSVKDGSIRPGDTIKLMATGGEYDVSEVGVFSPKMNPIDELRTGEVGYVLASIKTIHDVKIGDTVTSARAAASEPLAGFENPQPMVFCGVYPTENGDYDALRKALEKLWLNDSSFVYTPETSEALGFGFRCGFLGLLHMEITQERLERESGIAVVQTAPTVTYEVVSQKKGVHLIDSPSALPEGHDLIEIREPIVSAHLILPSEYLGTVMKLLEDRRATFQKTEFLSAIRVQLSYMVPLAELVQDFYDKLKSATRGYGTLDYTFLRYEKDSLVKLNVLVAGAPVDALSTICHRDVAERRGRALLKKLKEVIPRHMFQVPLQTAIGARVVARENIPAMSKNVTAKCYGGDVSRKRKLLEKQKEGKRRLKQVGRVQIPQDAFLAVLRLSDDDS